MAVHDRGLVKVSPGLGLVYLALQRRWRDVIVSAVLGAGDVGVSYIAAPDLWREWLATITGRADIVGNSLIPVPYLFRAVAGFVLAVDAGLMAVLRRAAARRGHHDREPGAVAPGVRGARRRGTDLARGSGGAAGRASGRTSGRAAAPEPATEPVSLAEGNVIGG